MPRGVSSLHVGVSVTHLDLRSLRCVRCDAVLTLHEQMRDHIGEVGRARAVLRVSDGVRDVRVVLEVGVDAVPAVREVDLSSVSEATQCRGQGGGCGQRSRGHTCGRRFWQSLGGMVENCGSLTVQHAIAALVQYHPRREGKLEESTECGSFPSSGRGRSSIAQCPERGV